LFNVPTDVKLEEITEEFNVFPERVPAAAVAVIFAVPLKLTPLIVLAVARPVAVVALPVTFPVTFPVTLPIKDPVTVPTRSPSMFVAVIVSAVILVNFGD